MVDYSKLVPLAEFARQNGRTDSIARKKCRKGQFETAIKIGKSWFVSPDQEWRDDRVKSGKYIGYRERFKKHEKPE